MSRRKDSPAPEASGRTDEAPSPNARLLRRPPLPPGKRLEVDIAELLVHGVAANTLATIEHSVGSFVRDVDLTALHGAMEAASAAVAQGDLKGLERMLAAQAVSLNAMFVSLSQQSRKSSYMDHADRYLRLALRAQSQCRATAETLAVMLNPPAIFARQANVVQGDQQVNNGVVNHGAARTPATISAPNKLLERYGDERLDLGTKTTAVGRDSALEAMDALDGPSDGDWKGDGCAKSVSRRQAHRRSRPPAATGGASRLAARPA